MNKNLLMIRNGFIRSERFMRLYDFFAESAKKRGIELENRTNIELMCDAASGKHILLQSIPRATLFWDKDIRLAYQLEHAGSRLFNSARAIELCDDKSRTHIALCGLVPMPKTIIAPLAYPRVGYTDDSFIERAADELGLPMIVKECYGSFGMQVYLVNDIAELRETVHRTVGMPILFQEYVKTSHARDIRIYIVGGRIAAAMLRENDSGDFRANLARGGRATAIALSKEQADVALKASQTLELDFCGVDLLFGKNDEPLLCEVNSNAHFVGLYHGTGVNVADLIMEHIDNSTDDWEFTSIILHSFQTCAHPIICV